MFLSTLSRVYLHIKTSFKGGQGGFEGDKEFRV